MPLQRCGRCAAAVGPNDESCVTCGARVPRGALSARGPLVLAVATLVVLVVGVGALAAATLVGDGRPRSAAEPEPMVREESAGETSPFEADVEELAVGDAAEAGGARVTLDGVRALPATEADQPREAGYAFLAGTLTFENVSEQPLAVSDLLEFALEDEGGRTAVRTFHAEQRPLDEGAEVAPGEKASGELVYEVPPDARGLRLSYDPAGRGSYAWAIGDAGELVGPVEAAPNDDGPVTTEAAMIRAVEDYYWAVDRQDWAYTYANLASRTRSAFTEAEWYQKNGWFADNYPARLAALEVETRMFTPSALVAEVTVNRTFADGSSEPRDTTFVYESGSWKHLFTQQETDLFLPGVPFEQFVAAQ